MDLESSMPPSDHDQSAPSSPTAMDRELQVAEQPQQSQPQQQPGSQAPSPPSSPPAAPAQAQVLSPVVGPRHAILEKKEDGPGPRCGHTLTAVAAVGEEGTPGYIGPRLILFGGATALEGNSAAAGTPSAGSAGIRTYWCGYAYGSLLLRGAQVPESLLKFNSKKRSSARRVKDGEKTSMNPVEMAKEQFQAAAKAGCDLGLKWLLRLEASTW